MTCARSLMRATLDTAMNASHAARAQWRPIAFLPSGPRIAILGTSSTAGCGAAEDVPGAGRSFERGVGLARACLVERSWGRHLLDYLTRHLRHTGAAPSVHIAAKNAVPASFYERCTARHLPANTHVVLLEVMTNLFRAKVRTIVSLVTAVRRAAPHAAVAFVMWPSQYQLRYAGNGGGESGRVQMLLDAAAQAGADVLRADLILRPLARRGALPCGSFPFKLYAQRNADLVHPSPVGHQLLGAIAARFVAKRLADAACDQLAGSNGPAASDIALSPPPLPPPSLSGAVAVSSHTVPSRLWEQCFTVADQMPVLLSGSWRLVDEGDISKGVHKLGYLSTAVGDTLHVGPLRGPTPRRCALLRVTLGYQLSAARTDLGALRISCRGCECARMYSRKERYDFDPFPFVHTDARYARNGDVTSANATVTAETDFFLLWHGETPCNLHVLHAERDRSHVPARSSGDKPAARSTRDSTAARSASGRMAARSTRDHRAPHRARGAPLSASGRVAPHPSVSASSDGWQRQRHATRVRVDSLALAIADEDAIVSLGRVRVRVRIRVRVRVRVRDRDRDRERVGARATATATATATARARDALLLPQTPSRLPGYELILALTSAGHGAEPQGTFSPQPACMYPVT